TMPDKEGGRGKQLIQSDVKRFATERNLRVLQPEKLKDPEFISNLKEINADLFIVIAFRMLPEIVWAMPRLGTFNLHGSLLPKYRGAAPINRAIMNGERETGVTTFFLKHEIDTGDIIGQRKISIGPNDNVGMIYDSLMKIGSEMVLETVDNIIAGNLKSYPQPEGEFIAAPKIFKEDCKIDWNKTSQEIHNHVRGLSPYPTTFTLLTDSKCKEMIVKIFETALSNSKDINISNKVPGDIIVNHKKMYAVTGDGYIEIKNLQPAGKRRMVVSDFLLGYNPIKFF
ncbi:MAG: methionyl-tRNA formyltransferase, partial [Roseburia sp.]|nr:methionyl-tRNA formyltransferase [Roseburia sp.]